MTVRGKATVLELNRLLRGDATGLTAEIIANPMLLDRVISLLSDVRIATTERAKTRFRLIKSYWPNYEAERQEGASVSWFAHDARNHKDIEVLYDFARKEYSIRDKDNLLEAKEVAEALPLIYAILPERELKMIAFMQRQYEAMNVGAEIKRAGAER